MKNKIMEYISLWESRGYRDGLPDEVPNCLMRLNKAPSYKAICLAILQNDAPLKTLGFTPKVCESYKALKKLELESRENIQH